MLTALVVLVTLALAGCSGGDDDEPSGTGDGETATPAIETDAALGKVRGDLPDAQGQTLLADVTAAVDVWIDGALGGDYPRSDFDAAFAGFTADARALALDQPEVMSNAALGADLDGAEITERRLRVDVLAPEGKAAGATARVRLSVDLSGGVERTDKIVGRLLLTPTKNGWKVFGFDVRRGEEGS